MEISTIKNIYFIQNLHGIQYFLSAYNPSESNLVVISRTRNKSLQKFLQEIMPNEKIIVVPYLTIPRHPLLKLPFAFYVFLWRIRYTKLFRKVKSTAKAYCLHEGGPFHFFILLAYLSGKGVEIKNFIPHLADASRLRRNHVTGKFYVEDQQLPLLPRIFLALTNAAAGTGTKLKYFNIYSGLKNAEIVDYRPLSWDLLAKKYRWNYKNNTENAILLVSCSTKDYPGINGRETKKNLVPFFTEILDKGMKIHAKPHYGDVEADLFHGTPLENKIEILPEYFPVELIMNQYKEVYFFASFSCSTPIRGKKYSLAKLVVFNSKESKDRYWKYIRDNYGNEAANIEFLEPTVSN